VLRIEYFDTMALIWPVVVLAYVLDARLHDEGTPLPRGILFLRVCGLVASVGAMAVTLLVVAGVEPPTRDYGLFVAGAMLFVAGQLPWALVPSGKPNFAIQTLVIILVLAGGAVLITGAWGVLF